MIGRVVSSDALASMLLVTWILVWSVSQNAVPNAVRVQGKLGFVSRLNLLVLVVILMGELKVGRISTFC